jgi:tetratricopeptide (TPR) repeat protein
MKKTLFTLILFLPAFCFQAFSQSKDNAELLKMYQEDQSARLVSDINWKVLSVQDRLRERRVYELLKEGKIVTGKDYYHSAMIFQHGADTVASSIAVRHMKKAVALDPTVNKWLLAAAIDRDLMRRDQAQIYGTQYVKMKGEERWKRYKMDSTRVTDADRKFYGVETLAEQRQKEREMNLTGIAAYHKTSKSIAETVAFIRTEKKKGYQSEYNVSENEINNFGYELMNAGTLKEALEIFRLNTEMYPASFNAFDSYGEGLLKDGQKEAGLEAYRKSLLLNPENENAKSVLKSARL